MESISLIIKKFLEKNVLIRYPKVCFIKVEQIKDDIFELNSLHLIVHFDISNLDFDYKLDCLNECWQQVYDIFRIAMAVSKKDVDCDRKIVKESSTNVISLSYIIRRESILNDMFNTVLEDPEYDPCIYPRYEQYKRILFNKILSDFLYTHGNLKIDGSEFNEVQSYLSSLFWKKTYKTYHDADCEN